MESNMKNFDDLFRDGLADHSEVPPARVWQSLEQRLDARAAANSKSWLWYAGVASVALVLGGLAWSGWRSETPVMEEAPMATVMPVSEPTDGDAIANENAAAASTHALPATVRHSHISREGTGDNVQPAATEERVSKYGNAPAKGTSVHSYDDFDERALASADNKLSPDEGHREMGYRINKIQKNRLKAAEMVPVGGVPTPPANQVVAGKSVAVAGASNLPSAASAARVRRMPSLTKPAPSVVKPTVTTPAADPATGSTQPAAAAPDLPTSSAMPAQQPVQGVSAPVANTSVDAPETDMPVAVKLPAVSAARSKNTVQASAVSFKPSTGGSAPRLAEKDTMQHTDEEDTKETAKPRGLRGIFRRVMGN